MVWRFRVPTSGSITVHFIIIIHLLVPSVRQTAPWGMVLFGRRRVDISVLLNTAAKIVTESGWVEL